MHYKSCYPQASVARVVFLSSRNYYDVLVRNPFEKAGTSAMYRESPTIAKHLPAHLVEASHGQSVIGFYRCSLLLRFWRARLCMGRNW